MAAMELCVDEEVVIAPGELNVGAYNAVCHPDGAIWLNSSRSDPGLFMSADQGRSWTTVPVHLPEAPPGQHIAGLFAARDGRLWIVHQADEPDLNEGEAPDPRAFVSRSGDHGQTWETTGIDYGSFAPGAPKDPYTSMGVVACHPNFVERPDGTLMFSASMRYDDWDDFSQADQTRPGIRDVMIRSTDGGRTWGDPTIVHQHATETAYAVDPGDPDHIIAATRIQRYALPGEDPEKIKKEISGVPYPPESPWCYKNGLLMESTDGGRTFCERPEGLYGFASYRWIAIWTQDNILILVSFAGQELGETRCNNDHVARVSLDGGRRWVDGTPEGTTAPNQARKFVLVPARAADDYSDWMAATVQLAPNRFMSTCRYKKERTFKGLFWHFEGLP